MPTRPSSGADRDPRRPRASAACGMSAAVRAALLAAVLTASQEATAR